MTLDMSQESNDELQPVFMDFEASGLSKDSYPIEVAWSNTDSSIESYLIRPEPSWTHWDEHAEVEIHGISRDDLMEKGLPVEWVVGRMRGKLMGQYVYVDGGEFDAVWCEKLFDYKGYSGKLPFRMKHFVDLLVFNFGPWTVTDKALMAEIRTAARLAVNGQHRAEVDVRYLQKIYERVRWHSEKYHG